VQIHNALVRATTGLPIRSPSRIARRLRVSGDAVAENPTERMERAQPHRLPQRLDPSSGWF